MNKQKAAKEIAEKTAEAMRLVRECEKIADENDIDFSFSVSYGMGGTYVPKRQKPAEKNRKSSVGSCWGGNDDYDNRESGWQASSNSC